MSGFCTFILHLSKFGNISFRSKPNESCLFSSTSLSFVGDNSLVHEHDGSYWATCKWNATCYTRIQSVMGGKLFSSLDPKNVQSHEPRTLAPIFTNRTSFSPESEDETIKIMKSQKIPWRLGSEVWTAWAQKICQGISLEPKL